MASHRRRQPALLDCLYNVNKFSSSYLNDDEVVMPLLTEFLLCASLVWMALLGELEYVWLAAHSGV